MHEWMDGWMGGWMDGWIYKYNEPAMYIFRRSS